MWPPPSFPVPSAEVMLQQWVHRFAARASMSGRADVVAALLAARAEAFFWLCKKTL